MFVDQPSPLSHQFFSGLPDKHMDIASPMIKDSPHPWSPGLSTPGDHWSDNFTVSPHQVFSNAVPSGVMSNFTTPSSEFEASPNFEIDDDFGTLASMPLFPDAATENAIKTSVAMERDISSSSVSKGSSPAVGKIQKKRQKKTDLPAIQFDPSNPSEVKRAKNTAAARKSREKKAKYVDELEDLIRIKDEELRSKNALIAELSRQRDLCSCQHTFL